MKEVGLDFFTLDFHFPAKEEPVWKTEVDRWYQLDSFAYGLPHFYQEFKNQLGPHPSLILLASPLASNETDFAFVKSGTELKNWSPGKFVHTLPSVRVSPLCQVMKWTGTTLCIQNDPATQISALEEASWMLQDEDTHASPIWILSVEAHSSIAGKYSVHCFVLNSQPGTSAFTVKVEPSKTNHTRTDADLTDWLTHRTRHSQPLPLSQGCTLYERNSR